MRRVIHVFMFLCLMVPLAGMVALLSGVAEPGDGEGSITTMRACFVFAATAAGLVVFWKVILVALGWIERRQMALLSDNN